MTRATVIVVPILSLCPWLHLLRAEGARHIFGQGPHSEPTRFLPMRLSSHTVCHYEEGEWFRRSGGRGGRHAPLGDQDGIFVRSVLASYAWILVGSHLQGEH